MRAVLVLAMTMSSARPPSFVQAAPLIRPSVRSPSACSTGITLRVLGSSTHRADPLPELGRRDRDRDPEQRRPHAGTPLTVDTPAPDHSIPVSHEFTRGHHLAERSRQHSARKEQKVLPQKGNPSSP